MSIDHEALIAEFHKQTSKINWKELVPYFARDVVWCVDKEEDLLEVACLFAQDDANTVEALMSEKKLSKLSTERAKLWAQAESHSLELWAVVVAPWVLVQAIKKPVGD